MAQESPGIGKIITEEKGAFNPDSVDCLVDTEEEVLKCGATTMPGAAREQPRVEFNIPLEDVEVEF